MNSNISRSPKLSLSPTLNEWNTSGDEGKENICKWVYTVETTEIDFECWVAHYTLEMGFQCVM